MSNSFDSFDPQETIKKYIIENNRLQIDYERAVGRCQYLEAHNARLRQQLQSLVEAWNTYWKRDEDGTLVERLNKLHAAFLAVQSAQETEEK